MADESMSVLDHIRTTEGNEEIRGLFYDICMKNTGYAAKLLNDDKLQYPVLFIFQPEILKFALHPYLSQKNRLALEISKNLVNRKKTYRHNPGDYPILLWMFLSGCKETELGEEFDKIIDFCAILLVKVYQDKTILKPLEELIFNRYKKGRYTYDAEWAFFESRSAGCIHMIAKRLLSQDCMDVELARKLLWFIPCMQNTGDPKKQHRGVMEWIQENEPYLYYTGESSQKGVSPCLYQISYREKYLQSALNAYESIPVNYYWRSLDLRPFDSLEIEIQRILSEYSQKLHKDNPNHWRQWFMYPLQKQIEQAKRFFEQEVPNG